MIYKLLLLKEPVITSNEELKNSDMVLVNGETYVNYIGEYRKTPSPPPYITNKYICEKIVAGTHNTLMIDFNGFEESLGFVDIEKLAELDADTQDWDWDSHEPNGYHDYVEGFISGYKKATEHSIYNEENVLKIIMSLTSTPSYISEDSAKNILKNRIKNIIKYNIDGEINNSIFKIIKIY